MLWSENVKYRLSFFNIHNPDTLRPSPTLTGSLLQVRERCSARAWRRQKKAAAKKKKEALQNYKKMMREPDKGDWASASTCHRTNEGRSRRRKEWVARKKSNEQERELETETIERDEIEKERTKVEEKMSKSRQAQRIEELSSAKV